MMVRGRADIQPVAGNQIVLRADRAADNVAAFQNEDLASRLGEITRAGQAVMARPNDGNVVG